MTLFAVLDAERAAREKLIARNLSAKNAIGYDPEFRLPWRTYPDRYDGGPDIIDRPTADPRLLQGGLANGK